MAPRKLKHYFGVHKVVVLIYYPIKNILGKLNQFSRVSQIAIELSEFEIQYKPIYPIKVQALAKWTQESTVKSEAQFPILVIVATTFDLWKVYVVV